MRRAIIHAARSPRPALLALGLVVAAAGCQSNPPPPQAQSPDAFSYPVAERVAQVDQYHGTTVTDPYRWLEDLDSTRTKRWVEAQNQLAQPYLESIPARGWIKQRLSELWNYERHGVPVREGGRYFSTRNDGHQNQSVLQVADGLNSPARVLLDPNVLSHARVSAYDVYQLGMEVGRTDCDGVFMACTAVNAVEVVEQLERDLGKPVVTANQASFWTVMQRVGLKDKIDGFGSLLRLG